MTQAFNLSQFANKVNTSGQADLTTAVTGTLPIANGGTGVTASGSNGNVLTSNGTAWVSQALPVSGFANMQVFTAPGTFTTPATTTRLKVTVVGGGGGGGGSPNTGAGGGGGGGAAIYVGPVTVSTPNAVTVGSGGSGAIGPAPTTPATSGGTSSFGSLASATGGSGGTASFIGVAGGSGSAGTLQLRGAGGGRVLQAQNTPPTLPIEITGFGGASMLGGTTIGVPSSPSPAATAGNPGSNYGGGGSGANRPSPTLVGGAGATGVVIVEY